VDQVVVLADLGSCIFFCHACSRVAVTTGDEVSAAPNAAPLRDKLMNHLCNVSQTHSSSTVDVFYPAGFDAFRLHFMLSWV
jgi:hypothetical protein